MPRHVERTGQEEVEALEAAGGAADNEGGREEADQPGSTADAKARAAGGDRIPCTQRAVDAVVQSLENAGFGLDREEREEVGLDPVARDSLRGTSVSCRHGRTP
jgi:hypothetical protein